MGMTLTRLFQTVLLLSATGTVLAGAILLIQAVFRQRLSAALHYALWFVLLLRLLLPFTVDSPLNLARLLPQSPALVHNAPALPPAAGGPSPAAVSQDPNAADAGEPQGHASATLDPLGIAAILWAAGTAAMLLYIVAVNLLFLRRLRRFAPLRRRDLAIILGQCKKQLGIRHPVRVLCGPPGKTPMLWGVFTPVIVICEDVAAGLSTAQLRYVLLHELAHLKRGDLLANGLRMLVLAIHWFNPIIWVALGRMKQDCEIACDATVLMRVGPRERREYGETVIRLLQLMSSARPAPGTVGFASTYHKRRIAMIAQRNKTSLLGTLSALLLCAVLFVGCAGLNAAPAPSTTAEATATTAPSTATMMPEVPTTPPASETPEEAATSKTASTPTPRASEDSQTAHASQPTSTPQGTATPIPGPEITPTGDYSVAGINDALGFELFYNSLQALVKNDDRATLAEYVAYPITVNLGGKRVQITSEEDFVDNYDKIMTKAVKSALLNHEAFEAFVNYKGVMVGNGELWLNKLAGTKHEYSIYGINN